MKGVRKISKHSKKYLQCFIFLLLFFLTGCNPLNSFDSNSVEAEEHVAASGNGSGYIIDSYDIKQPDKKAKKVVKTYDTDTTDVTHISIVSALTDATESVLSNIADHVKLRREKREEEKKSRELEINKKYTEACADTAEELHDKKVAQEVIEAVEQEEENIIKEAEESKSEVLLDMDKEDK